MSAELIDPFAAIVREPMSQSEYDQINDDDGEAVRSERGYVVDAHKFLLRSLGSLAMTSYDPDGFAARTLRELQMRAKDGIPMNERGERL